MDELKLDEAISKVIVDGTLKGYLQYLEERKSKKESMSVSGAYAWTKGNHIDDQVSKIGQNHNVQFKIEKAGYTWEYLQFTVSENAENYMVIVKNSRRVKKSFDDQKKKVNEDNYLVNFADINTDVLKNSKQNFVAQPEQLELELNDPEEIRAVIEGKQLNVTQKYARFYIVTYEIDDETKIIKSIQLTMPNRQTMNLELIEDLSYLIQASEYEATIEDVEPIMNEKVSDQTIFSGDSNAFGYSIPEEEKEESGN
ncbi:hypothetical protein [Listeria ivanovii]|uniref:spr1630 family ClpXP-sensitive toxin n=1 Tax=Listeria ivanovii TaxID=1638 RepID=UPI0005127B3B|nr:hypothetical protein [Listeria ivanovii]AIS62058.1 hypothetical protein JL53_04645 [Listeria ivanovii subsp. londoniensis]MBK1965573.1 hypothetical protein [Listeria ivanovii subsp. londoniensis]MBK1983398.1 hypothetical protein [Listeria ivanovii subsp. londoniensis]MBK1994740.1 hypothetical protein [Listeria ivanovii subsp. londoniensis]MBK2002313.1 hypothetical protein [Listeria ivanovii subsp. londoniensis]